MVGYASKSWRGVMGSDDPELRRRVEARLADATMPLPGPGTRLGPYHVDALLGAGGMGQVFRGVDTRLGRLVAIKISNEEFSGRFDQEARAISSLNHPNICTLYDVGPNYLVMELVDGETLAACIKRGALSVELVSRYGAQIADALAAAHAKGIIHRDLKPGNIMVTKAGVKVLDFGLAKSRLDSTDGATMAVSHGAVGTPAYMAPEQLEGKPCDARADIYALGLVLHEMFTGKRPPAGQGLTASRVGVPARLCHIVDRCLTADPEGRWQSASDVKSELEWAAAAPLEPALERRMRKSRTLWICAAGAIFVVLVLFAALWGRLTPKQADAPTYRFRVLVPDSVRLAASNNFSVSPDGMKLAYLAARPGGGLRLWVHSLSELEPWLLAGTEISGGDPPPFWSPDSKTIVFYSDEKLKKTGFRSSSTQTICRVPGIALGGSWSRDGVIIFGRDTGGLMRVPAGGGVPAALTVVDRSRGERVHAFPTFLPDGRHFLYSRLSAVAENNGIYAGSVDAKPADQPTEQLVATMFSAQFVPLPDGNGKLLFLRDGTLLAQDFNTASLRLAGEPAAVGDHIGNSLASALFSASETGVLISRSTLGDPARFRWFDRQGKPGAFVGEAFEPGSWPALSDDGTQVLVSRFDARNVDLWLIDLTRDLALRLTLDPSIDTNPVWSPDRKHVAFSSSRAGHHDLYRVTTDGEVREDLLLASNESKYPVSWSRDGRLLLYQVQSAATNSDLWVLPMEDGRAGMAFPFVRSAANEGGGRFSPNGRWVAYSSDETGSPEIYVRSFARPLAAGDSWAGPRVRISRRGGGSPRWRGDGKELFYRAADGNLMSVPVTGGDVFRFETAQPLFKAAANSTWEVTGDGKRFLFLDSVAPSAPGPFAVTTNWLGALKR